MKWLAVIFSRFFNAISSKWLLVIIPREHAGQFWLLTQVLAGAYREQELRAKAARDEEAARHGGYQ